MAGYTTSEVLNEVAKIFTARVDPGKEAGTLNTDVEYQQLIDISSPTFLFHHDAIFYLAWLARNRLLALVKREARFVEDMLVAVEDLGQLGKPVRDPTTLSNANTALLSLDAASSLQGRPETKRFSDLMDKYAEQYRRNVVSNKATLVRPRESARNILRTNLDRLKKLHDSVLVSVNALYSLLDNFVLLDIPTKLASTSLSRFRDGLDEVARREEDETDSENVEKSRQTLLTVLASKSAVNIIGNFTDPREFKFRSPLNPIPANISHKGRVTGEGDPASVIADFAPWTLPVSDGLAIKANSGSLQTLALNEIIGATMDGRVSEDFEIDTDRNDQLHVMVDPTVFEGTVGSVTNVGTEDECLIDETYELGFRHLGTPVMFPDTRAPYSTDSLYQRLLVEVRVARSGNIDTVVPTTGRATIEWGTLNGVDEPGTNLLTHAYHVGGYVLDSAGIRYEIIEISDQGTPSGGALSNAEVVVAVPDGIAAPSTGASTLHAENRTSASTKFLYAPPRTDLPIAGDTCFIGPAVKTVSLTVGDFRSAANIVADVQSETGVYGSFPLGGNEGMALNRHVQVRLSSEDPTKISMRCRSSEAPYLQIAPSFLNVPPVAGLGIVVESSAAGTLGFRMGELDTSNLLTASELAAQINGSWVDVEAEVLSEDIVSGTGSVEYNAGTILLIDSSTNFDDAGVLPTDQVQLSGELVGGTFLIDLVSGGIQLNLDATEPYSEEKDVPYRVFRESVKISTTRKNRGAKLEVDYGPSEMGLPGMSDPNLVVYGSVPQFEAVNKLGELLDFAGVRPGDFLRLVGSQVEYGVVENQGTTLVLGTGLSSNTVGSGFEILSGAAKSYRELVSSLDTFLDSPNLLAMHGFDEGIETIENAVTLAILPGRNFASNRNQARRYLADLLSILTDQRLREDEYDVDVPTASANLREILDAFTASSVKPVDRLIDSFIERKYDRAAQFLQTAQIAEFYSTTAETASFGGAVMAASRDVYNDLPTSASMAKEVTKSQGVSSANIDVMDANQTFRDYESGPEDISE
jgi:hypothetical protein